jgi:Bacterial regulatory proteins, luxR family
MSISATLRARQAASRSPRLADTIEPIIRMSRLLLSRSTVKTHFEHIYAKLGVSNRVAAVATALRAGLIE